MSEMVGATREDGRWSAVLLLLVVCALLPACNSPVTACTLIGCTSGIEVQLEEEPSTPYMVEAEAGGEEARYVFECDDPAACSRIFFAEFTPDWVRFEVIAGSDTTSYEVRPTYTEHQPNGPGCEPTCLNAVVRLPSDALLQG